MTKETAAAVASGLAQATKEYVAATLAPLEQRIAALEAQLDAKLKAMRYRGVWLADEQYIAGNSVTVDGSVFMALRDSKGVRPGDDARGVWQLAVKRGRDGKDAR